MGNYAGLTVFNSNSERSLGQDVSGIGDINGDGLEDFAVLDAQSFFGSGNQYATGQIFVVFGDGDPELGFDVASIDGTNGFVIKVERPNGTYGSSITDISGGEDVNGDGMADLAFVVGQRYSFYDRDLEGAGVYVVFGKDSTDSFDALETSVGMITDGDAIVIDKDTDAFASVSHVELIADMDGDGLAEILINESGQAPYGYYYYGGGNINPGNISFMNGYDYYNGDRVQLNFYGGGYSGTVGMSYVVFGDTALGDTVSTVDLNTLDGSNGIGIDAGPIAGANGEIQRPDAAGPVVALGDVNGDGFTDIGGVDVDYSGGSSRVGVVDYASGDYIGYYVISYYGGPTTPFVIFGRDVDGGAIGFDPEIDPQQNLSTAIDQTPIGLDNISTGFRGDVLRGPTAAIGDVNGDGFDDVAIVDQYAAIIGTDAYGNDILDDRDIRILFGSATGLDETSRSVSLHSSTEFFYNSTSIAGVGDVNGDGVDDFVIGEPDADLGFGNSNNEGRAYLVFGDSNFLNGDLNADLEEIGDAGSTLDGYILNGVNRFDSVGNAVSSGDVNGDGINDIIIGADNAGSYQYIGVAFANAEEEGFGQSAATVLPAFDDGATFVLFGSDDGSTFEAADAADGASDNDISVANLGVDIVTGELPIVVSVANTGFRVTQFEGDSGPTIFSFDVQRTGDLTQGVSFDYQVSGSGFNQADGADFVGGVLPSGTVDFVSGEPRATVEIEVNGDFDIETSEDFVFELTGVSNTGASNVSLGVTSSLARILNEDFPASVRVLNASSVEEGGELTFTVQRSGDLSSTVSVDLTVGSTFGSADPADISDVTIDGVSLGGGLGQTATVTFAPTETTKIVTVQTVDDFEIEGQESLQILADNLVSDGPASISDSSGNGWITDNDFAPEIFVSGRQSVFEGSGSGVTPVEFEIVRRGDTTGVTEVTYDLNPLPFAGDFFAADSNDVVGTLPSFGNVVTFADGESSKIVTVEINHDGIIEPREQFELRITDVNSFNSSVYNILAVQATVTIINDDGRPPNPPPGVEADVFGDPHIVTLDGLGYDFQAVGEYVLVESTIVDDPRDLQVQVRFEPLPGSDLVSVTTRMAVEVSGSVIEIDALGSDPLLIDGVAVSLADIALGAIVLDEATGTGVFFDEALSEFTIVLNDLNEQLQIKNMDGVLNVCVFLSDAEGGHANNVIGLMGNANNDTTDDLMTRDGATTYTDPTFEELYVDYADSWRVTSAERDFTDAEGTGDFPADFPIAKISIDDLPESVRAAAEAAVLGAGITDPIIAESAILDFALTGNQNFVIGATTLAADPETEVTVTEAPETPLSVGVTAVDQVVNEDDGNPTTLDFTFYRLGDDTDPIVIDYAIGGDVDADDLLPGTPLTGQVTIPALQGSASLSIGVVNDAMSEEDEDLTVTITGTDLEAAFAAGVATTTIVTDDFAPEAIDDVFSVGEDGDLVGNLLNANPDDPDFDADSDTLTVISAMDSDGNAIAVDGSTTTLPSGAVIAVSASGAFTFDPTSDTSDYGALGDGAVASEVISYTISDGNGGEDTATATINVTGANDAPTANDSLLELQEDVPTDFGIPLLVNDPEGDDLEFATLSAGVGATVTQIGDLNFTVTPDQDFNGDVTITYSVTDGTEVSNEATIVATVIPVNDAPELVDGEEQTTQGTAILFDPLDGATDVENDPISVESISAENGEVVEAGDGLYQYTPDPTFAGLDTITVVGTDGTDTSEPVEIFVSVSAAENTPPTIVDDSATVTESATLSDNVLDESSDVDMDMITLTAASVGGVALTLDGNAQALAGGGLIGLGTDGALFFDTNGEFEGLALGATDPITVSFTASDGEGGTGSGEFEINVLGENDAPTANGSAFTINEDEVGNFGVTSLVNDLDGDELEFETLSAGVGGSVTQFSDLGFNFTPDQDFNGEVTITYSVTDGTDVSNEATIVGTVTPVNDAPELVDGDEETDAGVAITIDVLDGATDAENDPITVESISAESGDLEDLGDGVYRYTPAEGFTGEDDITVVATDGEDVSEPATITVTVAGEGEPGKDLSPEDFDNFFAGSDGPDPHVGTDQDDWMEGGAGRDDINGGAGRDYIIAGPGDDWWVKGGADGDYFQWGYGDGVLGIVDFELGLDQICLDGVSFDELSESSFVAGGISHAVFTTGAGERLILRGYEEGDVGADSFEELPGDTTGGGGEFDPGEKPYTPEQFDAVFAGTDGADPHQGTDANEWIEGGAGRDDISGGAGRDYIIAGPGDDWWVKGGAGDDWFQFGAGDGILGLADFAVGADTICLDGLSFEEFSTSSFVAGGISHLVFTAGSGERLVLRGYEEGEVGADSFEELPGGSTGGGGEFDPGEKPFDPELFDAVFAGSDGPDPHQGTSGNDYIEGGAGNDYINGGAGRDYIIAGTGDDWWVKGGAGDDWFQFGEGDGVVSVVDFEVGSDEICLDGFTFDELAQSSFVAGGVSHAVYTAETGERLVLRGYEEGEVGADSFETIDPFAIT